MELRLPCTGATRSATARVGVERLKAIDPMRIRQRTGRRARSQRRIGSHTALSDCYATLHILLGLLRREVGRLVRGITVDDTNLSFTGDHGFGGRCVPACTTC
jgi:hypothetical protein